MNWKLWVLTVGLLLTVIGLGTLEKGLGAWGVGIGLFLLAFGSGMRSKRQKAGR